MQVHKAIKLTMDKASKIAKDIFKNEKKLESLKQKLTDTLRSDMFQNYKIAFETGAAVGGVIMFIEYYLDPPAKQGALDAKIDELFEKLQKEIENQGLKSEEVKVEVVQENDLMERIKELEQESQAKQKIIDNNKRAFETLKNIAIVTLGIIVFFAMPSILIPSLKAIEESIK